MSVSKSVSLGLVIVGAVALCAVAQNKPDAAKPASAPAKAAAGGKIVHGSAFPSEKCLVSGDPIPADGPVHQVQGRNFHLCCKDCIAELDKNGDTYVKKFDEAVIAAQKPTYPLDTCPLTGKKTAVQFVVGDRLIQTCCKNCQAKAEKDPSAALQKIDEAVVAAQKDKYPLKTCVACDKPLGDGAVNCVVGTRLVRVCSDACVQAFEKNEAAGLKKLAGGTKTN
ncbi:MAG: hypothetical protein U1E76_28240 [Planctomycetota bacterium]